LEIGLRGVLPLIGGRSSTFGDLNAEKSGKN
jgi:hypothetical protein